MPNTVDEVARLTLDGAQEERARALHFESFVFDFSPYGEPIVLTPRVRTAMDIGLQAKRRMPEILRQMWLERLAETSADVQIRATLQNEWKESGVNGVQVTLGGMEIDIRNWDALVRDAARWYRRSRIGDDFTICTSAEAFRRVVHEGKSGVMFGLQDTLPIGTDLDRLETLYGLGVRVVQLTYNRRNLIGDGCTERQPSGLSTFGLEFIRHLNRLGIAIDLSHCGYRTTIEAIDHSEKPVAFTHTSCKAVTDHTRAKSDDELRLLGENDGYVGILAIPDILSVGGRAGIADMIDHIEHAADLVGPERVGIATDWGIWSTDFPQELFEAAVAEFKAMGFRPDQDGATMHATLGEFVSWSDWPHITRGLVSRGFSDEHIRGFLGGNWLRFIERSGIRES